MIERYTLPEMAKIWTDENRFSAMLKVEVLACEAQAKLGNVSRADLLRIKKKAGFTVRRIKQIEAKTRHDVIALFENVAERVGPSGRYLHMGMNDRNLVFVPQGNITTPALHYHPNFTKNLLGKQKSCFFLLTFCFL